MFGQGWPWPAMAGHGWSWPAMAGHVAWQWAGHGQQWPAMAGHGWSCQDNGQSMVSQGPSAQAHGNVWHCVPLFRPESCTLHQAAIPTPGLKPKILNQSFQNKASQTPQLRVQRNPKHNSQTQDLKPQIPNRCYSKLLVRVTLG